MWLGFGVLRSMSKASAQSLNGSTKPTPKTSKPGFQTVEPGFKSAKPDQTMAGPSHVDEQSSLRKSIFSHPDPKLMKMHALRPLWTMLLKGSQKSNVILRRLRHPSQATWPNPGLWTPAQTPRSPALKLWSLSFECGWASVFCVPCRRPVRELRSPSQKLWDPTRTARSLVRKSWSPSFGYGRASVFLCSVSEPNSGTVKPNLKIREPSAETTKPSSESAKPRLST